MFLETLLKALEALGIKHPGCSTSQVSEADENGEFVVQKLQREKFVGVHEWFLQLLVLFIKTSDICSCKVVQNRSSQVQSR